MVALGKKLYHDSRLSGDGTVSCATCHALDKGGCDQLRFSKGINGAEGDINAPTVYNAGFHVRQFWDGRAANLKEQAGGPVTNPIEMGAQWPDVIAALEKDQEYVAAFDALFGGKITSNNIQEAIATFEESLVTTGSKFDRYLTGEIAALAPDEREGYELFKGNACSTCHTGAVLGGLSFELMGRREDYFADRGGIIKPDYGRFNFTGEEEDRHKFKVPTLRNVAVTFPYFHDGITSDLKEVVRIMAVYNSGESLSEGELDRIVAFLNTLTGEYEGELLQ
jgi:cytochrome c peroxidase